jgi:hypothetical protein
MTQAKTSALGISDSSVGQVNLTYRTATATVGTPAAGLFYSAILGRAPAVDPGADLFPRLGVDRYLVQQIIPVNGEQGPNGEVVWKPINDRFDQVRYLGFYGNNNRNNSAGQYSQGYDVKDVVEITFYGTGINILMGLGGPNYSAVYSVDGGSEATALAANASASGSNSGRNYSPNGLLPVVSGLTLGVHTLRFRNTDTANGVVMYGYEVLNEQVVQTTATTTSGSATLTLASATNVLVGMDIAGTGIPFNTTVTAISGTTATMSANATASGSVTANFGRNFLKVPGGSASKSGKHLSAVNPTYVDYKSGFESGTLGTRGGRAIVYQKKDGSIAKAVQPVATSTLIYPNADHTSEEIVRAYFPRDFGCGKTDDWTYATATATTRSFVLDDNVTALVGNSFRMITSPGGGALAADTLVSNGLATDFITLVFVGTGLDIVIGAQSAIPTSVAIIDGVTTTAAFSASAAGTLQVIKLCSGLPYGSHSVKITSNGSSWVGGNFLMYQFNVYGPKKPTAPAGAIELADYNILANYVVSPTYASPSTGVIRKSGSREAALTGTWTGNAGTVDVNFNFGFNFGCATAGGYVEYTFFGTGIEASTYIGSTRAYNQTYSIDGSTNLSAYTTSVQAPTIGSVTFTASTGVVSGTSGGTAGYGAKVIISGLPLGLHKLRVLYNSGDSIYADSFDVICPVHAVKNNGPFVVQNVMPIGNQSIGDRRTFGSQLQLMQPSWAIRGINSSISTTSSSQYVTIGEIGSSVYAPEDGAYMITARTTMRSSSTNDGFIAVYIDGFQATPESINASAFGAGYNQILTLTARLVLSKGYHNVFLMWKTSGNTETMYLSTTNGTTAMEISKCDPTRY